MKLTKSRLKQIIISEIEQLAEIPTEAEGGYYDQWQPQIERIVNEIRTLGNAMTPPSITDRSNVAKTADHIRNILHRRIDKYLAVPPEKERAI